MELQEILERMHSGRLYVEDSDAFNEEHLRVLELLYDFNQTRPAQQKERGALLKEMFAEIGEDCYIEPPLHANWAGKHVHFGNHVYANFNLTLVDDTHIYVGDHVMFGPNVTVCTGTHPLDAGLRRRHVQYNLPVHIGSNVWIGGGAFILPGVTIGENSVIGANSVVTKDIPKNVIAVGNPCRVLRELDENDRKFYRKNHPVDID